MLSLAQLAVNRSFGVLLGNRPLGLLTFSSNRFPCALESAAYPLCQRWRGNRRIRQILCLRLVNSREVVRQRKHQFLVFRCLLYGNLASEREVCVRKVTVLDRRITNVECKTFDHNANDRPVRDHVAVEGAIASLAVLNGVLMGFVFRASKRAQAPRCFAVPIATGWRLAHEVAFEGSVIYAAPSALATARENPKPNVAVGGS